MNAGERRQLILDAAVRLTAGEPWQSVSTAAIAREAGVTRGLLHHYFGTRRELELAVVREVMRSPPTPDPETPAGRPVAESASHALSRWLQTIEEDPDRYLAAVGVTGVGAGAGVEAIVDEANERAVDRMMELAVAGGLVETERLRAILRSFQAFAEQAALEWLRRSRMTREQTHALLLDTLMHLLTNESGD